MEHASASSESVLITGASSGIGYALAEEFGRRGYRLILAARNEAKLKKAEEKLKIKCAAGTRAFPIDLSEPGSAEKLFKAVESLGWGVDILINNAGYGMYGKFQELNPETEKKMIQLNISTLTELTRLFLPSMMKKKRGKILNVASTAAFQPGPLMSVYYATKAYVLHFSEGIREELGGTGVDVSVLCPGPTESEFQKRAMMAKIILLKLSMMTASEVARMAYKDLMRRKAVIIPGWKNRLAAWSVRIVPRIMVRKIVHWLQK